VVFLFTLFRDEAVEFRRDKMRRFIPAIVLSTILCFGSAIPGFAQSSTPADSTSTAEGSSNTQPQMMKPFVLKLQHMAPEQKATMMAIMKSGHQNCFVEELNPGDDSSMILICGVGGPTTTTFSP
jgi:hypothetical protein